MKAGIVADNYKVPAFEKALTEAGFKFEKTPLMKDTTTITVEFTPGRLSELGLLCRTVHKAAFQSKAKDN